MNTTTATTTTAGSNATAPITYSLEQFYAFFVNPQSVVLFYQIGYTFTFILGFTGNIASLFTFSRPTLRKVSTGCLFITLATSDMLYLLMCIFDYLEFGLSVPFYRHVAYDELCRFRMFIMDVAQVLSAWILVTVSVDRWIRTRFPFKSGSICTPKKALMTVGVLILFDIGLHFHILTPMFGMLIPGFSILACGPNIYNTPYFLFYFLQWSIIQIVISCLVPAILMLVILIDIFFTVRMRKRAAVQPTQVWAQDNNAKRQKTLQRQMFILMFASIWIFLITSLPLAIYKISSPRQTNIGPSIYQIVTIWVGLQWFQSLFFAVGFYIHCLSSTLFRKEFMQLIRCISGQNQSPVTVMGLTQTGHRGQTQQMSIKH